LRSCQLPLPLVANSSPNCTQRDGPQDRHQGLRGRCNPRTVQQRHTISERIPLLYLLNCIYYPTTTMKLAVVAALIASASAFSVNKEVAKVCVADSSYGAASKSDRVSAKRLLNEAVGAVCPGGFGSWMTRSYRRPPTHVRVP